MDDWWDVVGGEERFREAARKLHEAFEAVGPFQVPAVDRTAVVEAELREQAELERVAAELRPTILGFDVGAGDDKSVVAFVQDGKVLHHRTVDKQTLTVDDIRRMRDKAWENRIREPVMCSGCGKVMEALAFYAHLAGNLVCFVRHQQGNVIDAEFSEVVDVPALPAPKA